MNTGVIALGDAFCINNLFGFVCVRNGMEALFTTGGKILPLPQTFDDFVGFKSWQILSPTPGSDGHDVLLNHPLTP